MNNNTNNNNTKTKNKIETISASVPLRVVSQNVQGLNSPAKQQQLLHFIKSNNIDIMGLAETKLNDKKATHIYKHDPQYKAFFNNTSDSLSSSGVGLLISNAYAKFIQYTGSYKGRIIHVDMFLKGHIKLRIIQVYLPHESYGRVYFDDIVDHLITLIEDSNRRQQKLIVMGDFNLDCKKFYANYNSRGSFHWKYRIIHRMGINNLVDSIDLYHDVDDNNPFNTFKPPSLSTHQPSRLDMIWLSRDLILETLASNILDHDFFSTDHAAVYLSLQTSDIFHRQAKASLKQHKNRKRIFDYDNMSDDQWEEFSVLTDRSLKDLSTTQMDIHNKDDLNRYWALIKKSIMNVAFDTIDNHLSYNKTDLKPENLAKASDALKFIGKFLQFSNLKNFRSNRLGLQQRWPDTRNRLRNYCVNYNLDFTFPTTIDTYNIDDIRKKFQLIQKCLKVKYDLINKKLMDERIKEFVRQRCENYKDAKGKMITSFLDKYTASIVIDRVLLNNTQIGQETLVTDPTQIKQHTIRHF